MKHNIACPDCGKTPLSRDEIGISKKLLGEDSTRILCLSCLATWLEVTEEELMAKIEEFKAAGCKLFS
jgi:hypothetical protein